MSLSLKPTLSGRIVVASGWIVCSCGYNQHGRCCILPAPQRCFTLLHTSAELSHCCFAMCICLTQRNSSLTLVLFRFVPHAQINRYVCIKSFSHCYIRIVSSSRINTSSRYLAPCVFSCPTRQVDVNGLRSHPLFAWLKAASGVPGDIAWNFTKFLVVGGHRVTRFSHEVCTYVRMCTQVGNFILSVPFVFYSYYIRTGIGRCLYLFATRRNMGRGVLFLLFFALFSLAS